MVQTTRSSAVLNGSNLVMHVPCSGTSSAVVYIDGTINATISVTGGPDITNTKGKRILTQTDGGSTGRNALRINGAIDEEFRLVTGGDLLKIELSDYVSGAVEVDVVCTEDPSIIFINGPVHTADEQAVRAGRAFVSAVPAQSVTTDQELHFVVSNPDGSGKNLIVTSRRFGATVVNTSDRIEYVVTVNPATVLNQSAAPNNRYLGESTSPAGTVHWQVAAVGAVSLGGTTGSSEPIPNNGTPVNRELLVIIPPGTALGFTIRGAGNNSGQAARLFGTVEWFEEDTY